MTVCKADRFDYVKSLGAEFAVDYTEEDAVERIRENIPTTSLDMSGIA